MPSATPRTHARSIAVLRALDGIGDMLCTVPALRSLRAGFPDADVTLIGLPSAGWFVARFPQYVDELVRFPGFPGIPEVDGDVSALPAFFAEMQERRFDLALQMQGSGSFSNPFTVMLGARRTAGFYLPGHYMPTDEFVPYPGDEHEIRRMTTLTEALGAPETGAELEWPVTPSDRAEAAALHGGSRGGYALVHPGAKQVGRRWAPEHFARVVEALHAEGLRVLLTGTAEDSALTAAVAHATSAPATDVCGRTTLGCLGALVEGARLVVANDTGISHIAAALRTPSVVVFSTASDPVRWAPLDAERHVAVHPPIVAYGCEGRDDVNDRCLRDGCHHFRLAECAGDDIGYVEEQEVLAAVAAQLAKEDARVCA
jgi:ADP-heptose:LPS heptosyltransferase